MFNRIFNSTLYFVVAYFLVHVIVLFLKLIMIKFVGIDHAAMYFTIIDFDPWGYKEWSRLKISLVYGLPTFAALIMAVLMMIPYKNVKRNDSRRKIFLLWFIVVALTFFITEFIRTPYLKSDLSSVYAWFFIPVEVSFAVSFISIPLIPLIGYFASRSVVRTTDTRDWIRSTSKRMSYFFNVTIVPLLIGSVFVSAMFLFISSYPTKVFLGQEFLRLLIVGLILLSGLFFSGNKKYINIRKSSNLAYAQMEVSAIIIIAMIILYALLWFSI